MTTYYDLTGFRRDLLQAIAAVDGEAYGLALKRWLDERYTAEINHSRLYQNLDYLVEAGLVTREPIDDRTNAYALTDDARRLLNGYAQSVAATFDCVAADGGDRDGER